MSLAALILLSAVSLGAGETKVESDLTHMVMKRGSDLDMPRFKTGAKDAGNCHPTCRWACNDPECPALCHPVCETPKCEVSCEQVPCSKCKTHCQKPLCSVRCPKDMCERANCPKCQVICAPGDCHTECESPDPVCAPVCEKPVCKWKCRKPQECPRPKCKLQCQRPTCESPDSEGAEAANSGCCPCDKTGPAAAAIEIANSAHANLTSIHTMSLLEVVDHARHKHQGDISKQCCPCAKDHSEHGYSVAKIAKTIR